MAKKLFESLYFVIALMVFIAVSSSLLSATLTGYVINLGERQSQIQPPLQQNPIRQISVIRANSCDADGTCEVTEEITTKYSGRKDLLLTSDTRKVKVNNQLTVTDQLTAENVVLKDNIVTTNSNRVLVLSSSSGGIIIDGNIVASSLMDESGANTDGYVCATLAGVVVKKREPCI